MNGNEILRIVDAIHRDKEIDAEIVFEGIELAIQSATRKHFGEEAEITVRIDRDDGQPSVVVNGDALEPDEIGDLMGRIAAQTAKQVMIQKIREAERDSLYDEYIQLKSQMLTGTVTRVEGGAAVVSLGKVEGILPRSEQIPGEYFRINERVRAIILDVRKVGTRVKIILSRVHPELVRRLFEVEIPEVAEHVIEVRSLAREAGYRSKVAVSCFDNKIDCVGACVGVRGARIRSIVDELSNERIDIVRWNDSLQVLVPNALQPAEVEDVILCPMLGKVIVLVQNDQLSLAIGKKGQNVRLASKLVGWDINVMNQEALDEKLDSAVALFSVVPEITEELAESLVAQGFFTFDDLSIIEPDQLAELGGLSEAECDAIVEYADRESEILEQEEIRAKQAAKARRDAGLPPEKKPHEIEAAKEKAAAEAKEKEEAAEAAQSETETDTTEEEATADNVENVEVEEDNAEEIEPSAEATEDKTAEESEAVSTESSETEDA